LIADTGDEPAWFVICFTKEGYARSHPAASILSCTRQLPLIGGNEGAWRIAERLKSQDPQDCFVPKHFTSNRADSSRPGLACLDGGSQGFRYFAAIDCSSPRPQGQGGWGDDHSF
jgi:hypothetical protein